MWPGYALCSLALLALVAGILFALGGLVQVNPIWQWGPYEPWQGTNGAQPDWYLGWLIGALRIAPPVDSTPRATTRAAPRSARRSSPGW